MSKRNKKKNSHKNNTTQLTGSKSKSHRQEPLFIPSAEYIKENYDGDFIYCYNCMIVSPGSRTFAVLRYFLRQDLISRLRKNLTWNLFNPGFIKIRKMLGII